MGGWEMEGSQGQEQTKHGRCGSRGAPSEHCWGTKPKNAHIVESAHMSKKVKGLLGLVRLVIPNTKSHKV